MVSRRSLPQSSACPEVALGCHSWRATAAPEIHENSRIYQTTKNGSGDPNWLPRALIFRWGFLPSGMRVLLAIPLTTHDEQGRPTTKIGKPLLLKAPRDVTTRARKYNHLTLPRRPSAFEMARLTSCKNLLPSPRTHVHYLQPYFQRR